MVLCIGLFLAFANMMFAKDSLTLYLFLLDDCVICQDYTVTLNELHAEYKEEVNFVGYFPNFSSKPPKIDSFAQKFDVQFSLKTDYYKTVTSQFSATVTPEVVLYDHDEDRVLYQGRINNKFYKIGRRRNVVTTSELADALYAATNGLKIEIEKTNAIGCFINYSDALSKSQK